MKKTILSIIILVSIFTSIAQGLDTIYFKRKNIKEFINYEMKLGSILYSDKETFGVQKFPFDKSLSDVYEYKIPILIYKRVYETFPTGLYIHLMENQDSTIRYVNFNWSFFNMSMSKEEQLEAVKLCSDKVTEFENKYYKLYDYLKNNFGEPIVADNGYNSSYRMAHNSSWTTDKLRIDLYTKFPKKITYNEKGFINEMADYSVNVCIYYKSDSKDQNKEHRNVNNSFLDPEQRAETEARKRAEAEAKRQAEENVKKSREEK